MYKRWSLDLQCQMQWAILRNTESVVRITALGISVLRKRIRLHPATGLAEPLNILAVVYQGGGKMKFPIMYENSRVPVWLSKITPINVWANSFAFWVWCRGEMSERTKNHETIHYVQQRELLMIFQWILYGLFHLIGLIKYREGNNAFY